MHQGLAVEKKKRSPQQTAPRKKIRNPGEPGSGIISVVFLIAEIFEYAKIFKRGDVSFDFVA